MVGREVALDVFDIAELFVARGVGTEVRERRRDWVCSLDGKEVFVDVTVLVEVFDCVDVDDSTIPLKRSSLWLIPREEPCPASGPHPMKKSTRTKGFILLCLTKILDPRLHRSEPTKTHQFNPICILSIQSLCRATEGCSHVRATVLSCVVHEYLRLLSCRFHRFTQ